MKKVQISCHVNMHTEAVYVLTSITGRVCSKWSKGGVHKRVIILLLFITLKIIPIV